MKQIKLKFSGDGSPRIFDNYKKLCYNGRAVPVRLGSICVGLAAVLFVKIFSVGREVSISSLFLLQDGARLTSSYEKKRAMDP